MQADEQWLSKDRRRLIREDLGFQFRAGVFLPADGRGADGVKGGGIRPRRRDGERPPHLCGCGSDALRHVWLTVISTLTQSKTRAGNARKTARLEKFWVRKANPELDRAGNWLLGNLAAVRAQAVSRAHTR